MNTPNEDGKQPEKMESPKQGTACCGPGCGCGTAAKPNKARWVVGVIVLGSRSPSPRATAAADETSVGTTIGAFAELNTVAIKTDAVFIYLPGKEVTAAKAPSKPMKAAARLIEGKGTKCGLFTLKAGSADYDKVAKQMAMPGVVALVKGRGMSAVSGEITEAKLVQGFVAAGSAGGCGPGAGAGCCPK